MNYLNKINKPSDIKKLSRDELELLAKELRSFIIDSVSKTGGHLSSNLGVIELTIALHYVYDCPNDQIIWDVGHQTYAHKILTGRRNKMHTLRQKDGISGFPRRAESKFDSFGTGHSSTSISAALGVSEAFKINNSKYRAIAVIGDGAMTAGMAFEGLNNAGNTENDILVILNDNDMSISNNVGALNNYLAKLLSGKLYGGIKRSGKAVLSKVPPVLELARKTEEHVKGMVIPGTLFEEFGFNYIGPIDGHHLNTMIDTLSNIKSLKGPQFLHVATKKGYGYQPAEQNPNKFHGVSKFDPQNGQTKKKNVLKTFTEVFSEWIMDTAAKESKLCAITPAMSDGSGLNEFSKKYPKRFFDVGIAEQHALTFAAGLACNNLKPVVAIYSTFLQRAYDQLIHDIALQNISMLFAIDRAGIVGADGATHSGNFDISYLRCIPNIIIMTPSNENECYQMLKTGFKYDGICIVRFPRGNGIGTHIDKKLNLLPIGKSEKIRAGENIVIFAFGPLLKTALEVAEELNATLIDMKFVKPIDEKMIKKCVNNHNVAVTIEDNAILGGAGSAVLEVISKNNLKCRTLCLGIPDNFVEHGTQEEIYKLCELDKNSIIKKIVKQL
ncbi:1-deoxy-D-xylulose-5-phosphate synthase [Methylophilaceae bacterium]|jgi:1-deoxy-D-xylulose-5-phosphate synthase|nr:1-deoxy-D-xylulose-5-phosphate synthase [Methylophilaceae bacterium]